MSNDIEKILNEYVVILDYMSEDTKRDLAERLRQVVDDAAFRAAASSSRGD